MVWFLVWFAACSAPQRVERPSPVDLVCKFPTKEQTAALPTGSAHWCEDPDGKRHGLAQERDEEGRVVVEETYRDGVLVRRLAHDRRVDGLATFVDYEPPGPAHSAEGARLHGALEGSVVYRDAQGGVLYVEEYRRGVRITSSDEEQIRAAFEALQGAVAAKRFDTVPTLVDRATLDRYEGLREVALRGDRDALARLPLQERLLVLQMRLQLGTALRSMSAADILARGVDPAPYTLNVLVARVELDEVRVNNVTALATTTSKGKRSPRSNFRFAKEDGRWRLDLFGVAATAEELLTSRVRAEGDEEKLIESYLAARTGIRPTAEVWKPIGD